MKFIQFFTLALVFTVPAATGCVATTTSSTVWTAPGPAPVAWARPGRVEWIRENVQREQGNPAAGALAGAVIGGLLLGSDGPSTVLGAIGGAAVGAAASQGSAEHRSYEVFVRFDDGSARIFAYQGYSPFQPGQMVVQTPNGLAPQ
jgi:outer membrane lipoprotein SlyB